MVAALFKLKKKFPLIITNHGRLEFGNVFYDKFERIYNRSFGVNILNAADGIVALSKSHKNYLSSLGVNPEKICIIPNGIDPESFSIDRYNNWDLFDKYDLDNKR